MKQDNNDLLKLLASIDEINNFLITSDFSLKSVLKIIIDKALELSGGTYGQILLYDGYDLKIAASTNNTGIDTRISVDECLCGEVVKNRQTLVLGNVLEDKRYNRFFVDSASELAVPLMQGGKILGVLNVESNKQNAFNEDTARTISTLALQASHTIKIASLYAQQKTLAEIEKSLASCLDDPDKVYNQIISGALKLINGRSGQLLLKEGDLLVIAATTGKEKPMSTVVNIDNCISGIAVREKRVVNIGNIKDEIYANLYKSYLGEMSSELVIPIIDGQEVIAVLNFEHSAENFFTNEHTKLLTDMANLSAIAIRDFRIAGKFTSSLSEVKSVLRDLESFPDKLSMAIKGIKKITEVFEEKEKYSVSTGGILPPTGDY